MATGKETKITLLLIIVYWIDLIKIMSKKIKK